MVPEQCKTVIEVTSKPNNKAVMERERERENSTKVSDII